MAAVGVNNVQPGVLENNQPVVGAPNSPVDFYSFFCSIFPVPENNPDVVVVVLRGYVFCGYCDVGLPENNPPVGVFEENNDDP